jgi:hypothetical protein
MKVIRKHNTIRLISLIFILLSFIGLIVACGRPIGMLRGTVAGVDERQEISTVAHGDERQEIIDYIKSVSPILKAHADFYEDADKLSTKGNISQKQAISVLKDLRDRIERIYADATESQPPQSLHELKRKWSLECELLIKSLTIAMQAIEENDIDLARESGDYKYKANRLRDEYQEELLDVLTEFSISISELR